MKELTLQKLEEKKQRGIERQKKIDLRIKQAKAKIKSGEKEKERKERASELIQIGLKITGLLDRKKLLNLLNEKPDLGEKVQTYLKQNL